MLKLFPGGARLVLTAALDNIGCVYIRGGGEEEEEEGVQIGLGVLNSTVRHKQRPPISESRFAAAELSLKRRDKDEKRRDPEDCWLDLMGCQTDTYIQKWAKVSCREGLSIIQHHSRYLYCKIVEHLLQNCDELCI